MTRAARRRCAVRCLTLAPIHVYEDDEPDDDGLHVAPPGPALVAEAERLLWRYVVEVVEGFDLCPWARRARLDGKVRVEVCAPVDAAAAAARIVADDAAVMGMVVVPRAGLDPRALRRIRDALLASPLSKTIAIADFHPDATADLTTAARAVPWFRRSPDPTLQLVRLSLIADLQRDRGGTPTLAAQAAILRDQFVPPTASVSDQVAARNLLTARASAEAIAAAVAAIHADRDVAYARLDAIAPGAPRSA